MTAPKPVPGIDDVRQAARRIAEHAVRTPLLHSPALSARTSADVWIKIEAMQITGSFKFRGAVNAVARIRTQRPDVSTLLTASAGNHGLALATAASRAGLRTRIFLPSTAPEAKRARLSSLGAEIVERATYDDAERDARDEAARSEAVFVSPYDDEDVIAGAGTVGLEMLVDQPDLDAIVVPVGGGGLIAGVAVVASSHASRVEILGAEAAASPVFSSALAAGQPVTVEVSATLADGLAGNMDPETRTFGMVRELVSRVVTVTEPEIAAAMADLAYEDRVIVEGAAAVGVAALVGSLALTGRKVGVVLSGRNVDRRVLAPVLGVPAS